MRSRLARLNVLRISLYCIAVLLLLFCVISSVRTYELEGQPRTGFYFVCFLRFSVPCLPVFFVVGTGIYAVSCRIGMYEPSVSFGKKRERYKNNIFAKRLLLSSVFPFMIAFVSCLAAVLNSSYTKALLFAVFCFVSGGAAPVIIMVITRKDTSDKLIFQFLFFALFFILSAFFYGELTPGVSAAREFILYAVVIGKALFMFIKRKSMTEWAVIMLSDPGVYVILTLIAEKSFFCTYTN